MGDVTYAPRQPGNYLQDYNDQFRDAPLKYPELSLEALAELSAYGSVAAEDASCWVINEAARDFIQNTTLPPDALADWQLPYPRMCIEWLGTWDVDEAMKNHKDGDPMLIPALERIIMLADVEQIMLKAESDHPKAFQGFYITSFCKQSVPAEFNANAANDMPWTINAVSLLVPYSCLNDLSVWMDKKPDGTLRLDTEPVKLSDVTVSATRPTPLCSLQSARDQWGELVIDGSIQLSVRDMIEEVHMAMGLLSMLRCDNVPTKVVQASRLKQDRRKKKNKSRIPDYRVLHISDHTLRGYAGGKGQHGEKAPHWRRGHIRMQPTAMGPIRKWIAPQIIRADKLNGDMPLPRTAVT